jgi:hypothetical protein
VFGGKKKEKRMRIERCATSVSWIPSDSLPGPVRLPFERGLMHYDPPPPLQLADLDGMRRRGEFRFANCLRAWIEVDDGKVLDCGYTGDGLVMGFTPFTAGPLRVMLPTKRNPEIRHSPEVVGTEATFVQTVGNRPGFSFVRPSVHWPFLRTRPFTIWTTIELTIGVDGSCRQRFVGASPFPRHWLYDDGGRLVEKAALTRSQVWLQTVFGMHTPWGGEDHVPVVAGPETALERRLSEQVMHAAERGKVHKLDVGEYLFRQSEHATSVALVLDGNLEVLVDGKFVGQAGPGTVIGELAARSGGQRTADLRALTECRVVEVPEAALSTDLLDELAMGHHRERDSEIDTAP